MAGTVVELTDRNWQSEVLSSDVPVLVDFWAPWCEHCRLLTPTIESLAVNYAGRVKVGKMNTDENTTIPAELGVSAIPTCIFFNGGQRVDAVVGVNPESKFQKIINDILAASSAPRPAENE